MLEDVANRRAVYFEQVPDWRDYEVLAAVEDCRLIGQTGWLITDKVRTAIVVDCLQTKHSMNGIMADTTLKGTREGWLILRKEVGSRKYGVREERERISPYSLLPTAYSIFL